MDLDSQSVWVSTKTRDLFQFAADEHLNVESFFKAMHPEDRLVGVNQIIQQAIETGRAFFSAGTGSYYQMVRFAGCCSWTHRKFNLLFRRIVCWAYHSTSVNAKKWKIKLEERLCEIGDLNGLNRRIFICRKRSNCWLNIRRSSDKLCRLKISLRKGGQVAETDSTVLLLGETRNRQRTTGPSHPRYEFTQR